MEILEDIHVVEGQDIINDVKKVLGTKSQSQRYRYNPFLKLTAAIVWCKLATSSVESLRENIDRHQLNLVAPDAHANSEILNHLNELIDIPAESWSGERRIMVIYAYKELKRISF